METDPHRMRGKWTEGERQSDCRAIRRKNTGIRCQGNERWTLIASGKLKVESGKLFGGFQFEVEHGADEVGELGVAFGAASDGIERRLRIGFGAAGRDVSRGIGGIWSWAVGAAGELGKVTFVEMGIECARFFEGVEVGDVVELLVEDLLLGETVWLCGLEDLGGTQACLAPAVVVGEFGALCGSLLPVARVLDLIGFLTAFADNTTALVAVLLLAIDDAFAFEGAVEFGDGGFENYECHIIVGYNPPIMADTLYVDHGDLCLWVAD